MVFNSIIDLKTILFDIIMKKLNHTHGLKRNVKKYSS